MALKPLNDKIVVKKASFKLIPSSIIDLEIMNLFT